MKYRSLNKKRGLDAEVRMADLLRNYGSVSRGESHYSAGYGGSPDLVFKRGLMTYGIEAKSIVPIQRRRSRHPDALLAARIKVTRHEWENLIEWCEKEGAVPLLLIEFNIKGKENLYFYIHGREVSRRFEEKQHIMNLSFTVWQAIRLGSKFDASADIIREKMRGV